ncbi:TetR/AcrR family transcriptional regulator [Streptacidiphilus rugosus]|uniref:TetR/AcrR family transcriptional regulator n=1 Tax=Streptacidiphilus rugosus TaxID=405783 RepID=UPI00055C1EAF|nr:TetR/AcrR family transcriptional regulator [Streptacidiphilus rugosus]
MTQTSHVPGRKRDASRDDALRQAALEVLAEVGYDRLTVDAVAARAGAGKATCYRRWAGKAELVVDAVSHMKARLEQPDTGSLRGDLLALTSHAHDADDSFRVDVQAGLVSGLVRDAQLREVFAEQFVAPRKAVFRTVFDHAIQRGEIPPAPDVELLSDIVPSMVFHQLILTGRPPDAAFILKVIDRIVLPLAAHPNQNQTRTPSS